MFSLQVVPRKRSISETTQMAPPTGTHLPSNPLPHLKGRGYLLKTSLPDPLPLHRALPGGSDAAHKALSEYTTYYLTLKATFTASINTRSTQLHLHLSSGIMSLVTFMREREALIQCCFDTHLALVREVMEFIPILGEPTPFPGLVELFKSWEGEMVKKRVEGMMVIRAQCVVVARAVSPVSVDEEDVAFRERFLGKGIDGGVAKKAGVQ